jgi:hypothetical protein
MFRGVAFHTPHFMGDIMIHNIILITSAMGFMAFGFLCYLQGDFILTAINMTYCVGELAITSIWIPDLAILVMTAIASTLCLVLVISEVQR